MQEQDQIERSTNVELTEPSSRVEAVQVTALSSSTLSTQAEKEFDWLAIGVVLLLAAIFALLARLNAQPATPLPP